MSKEKETVELKDEELEKVSGGVFQSTLEKITGGKGVNQRPDGAPSCWEHLQNADYVAGVKPGCKSCPFAYLNPECTGQFYAVKER